MCGIMEMLNGVVHNRQIFVIVFWYQNYLPIGSLQSLPPCSPLILAVTPPVPRPEGLEGTELTGTEREGTQLWGLL